MLTTGKEKFIATYITITDGNGELTELTDAFHLNRKSAL